MSDDKKESEDPHRPGNPQKPDFRDYFTHAQVIRLGAATCAKDILSRPGLLGASAPLDANAVIALADWIVGLEPDSLMVFTAESADAYPEKMPDA